MSTPENLANQKSPHTVLIVDDNTTNLKVLANSLGNHNFDVSIARSGELALKRAMYVQPDIILLDIIMPGMDGFETCRQLKENEATKEIPVIFMTALVDVKNKLKGFEVGAVDYVTKPLNEEEVIARVTTHLKIRKLTQSLQTELIEHKKTQEALHKSQQLLEASYIREQKRRQLSDNLLEETKGLFEAAQAILASTELSEVCQNLTTHFKKLVKADRLVIHLVDHKRREMILTMSNGNVIGNEEMITYDELEAGISGIVFKTGQPVLSASADDMIEPSETAKKRKREGVGPLIVVPLVTRGRVIGTVTALNRVKQRVFTRHDVDLLMSLATQAATAIENVRLYTVAQQELKERRRAEAALQKANEELIKTNASKDKFFSLMAHDLKGPFIPLLSGTQFLADTIEVLKPEETKKLAHSLYRAASNLHNLLDNLLQWSRLQMGNMRYRPIKIALGKIIERNIDLLSEVATSKDVILQNQVNETFFVYADENMLDTILRNLIANALKFTPKDGMVIVSAKLSDPVEETKTVEISVTDTGVGISPEDIGKLLNTETPHSTPGTDQEKGSGLGLVICQEMIELHGGRIWVESEVGKETTFHFTMPLG